jgi:LCP family protein required for cell wall assembly
VRVSLWSLLAVVCVAVGAVGYEFYVLQGVYARVTRLTGVDRQASKHLSAAIPKSGQVTALVIGSDHRKNGATGKNGLSDTLILVRMDPDHHIVSLLSVPRDLWVTIPGHGEGKINSAYSEGGDALSLRTVEAVTGVHPNYLLNVDFSGFQRLVDTLGGVYLNVDQHYYNPPAISAQDGFSEISIPPGYQLLNGANALAFSRYRHSDDDFHRQARQQTFLRAFEARASGRFHGISLTDIPFLNTVLDAISHSMTIVGPGGHAPSPQTLLGFASTAYDARAHVASIHVNWNSFTAPDGSAAVQVSNLSQALWQWRHPWLLGSATAGLPTGKHRKPHHAAWKPSVSPPAVSVAVMNGGGATGAASSMAGLLARWGYQTSVAGNTSTFSYPHTRVYYRPGSARAGADLAAIVGQTTPAPLPSAIAGSVPSGSRVLVVVGRGFHDSLAKTPPPPHHTAPAMPPTITPTTEYQSDFASARRKVNFPVLYPSVSQANSILCPWVPHPYGYGQASCQGTPAFPVRAYRIPAAGSGRNSLYAVFYDQQTNGYWGIEETRYTQAPLLATPTSTRTLDGRRYLFFANGSHLQTIAFIQNGTAYWVENALLDDLSNAEMFAIARSLRPLG